MPVDGDVVWEATTVTSEAPSSAIADLPEKGEKLGARGVFIEIGFGFCFI